MAEDNQDMEMEDILSSIKNILEEDEQKQSPALVLEPEPDVLDDVLSASSEVDDILELSPEMRIKEPETTFEDKNEITAAEVDPIAAIADEPSVDPFDLPAPATDNSGISIGVEDFESDSVFENSYQSIDDEISAEPLPEIDSLPEVETIAESELEVDNLPEVETIALPEIAEQTEPTDFIEAAIDEAPLAEETDLLAAEVPAENEPTEVEPINETIAMEAVAEPMHEADTVDEAEPASYGTEPVYEPINLEAENSLSSEEPEAPKSDDDVADVSANIISNFAKMFSREEVSVEAEKPAPVITAAGNMGKTLEEFVLEAVIKAIGQEISRQWNDGADFKALAEAEINRQTKEWLNDNLPSLVEKVVKQEIERVIAKVGS